MDGADRAGEAWHGQVSGETNKQVDTALGSEVRRRIAWRDPGVVGCERSHGPGALELLDPGRGPRVLTTSHSPVMEMASNAKPRYFPTPLSRTIPVPLDMSMAQIWLRQRRPVPSPQTADYRPQTADCRLQIPITSPQISNSKPQNPIPNL